jgi:putative nucleotidyltransferase with HDIG domain
MKTETTSTPAAVRSQVMAKALLFGPAPAFTSMLLGAIQNPDADVPRIVNAMRLDPGLTANVLRLANSAFFGMPRSVSSVNEAVVRLGTKRILDLIVATGLRAHLSKPLPGYGLAANNLLQHALWVAAAAEALCTELDLSTPDMLFTAGILHDIGKLLLSDAVAANSASMEAYMQREHVSFDRAEEAILGMNHAQAGAAVLDRWEFPKAMVDAVRLHHDPEHEPASDVAAAIIHVADSLAYVQGVGSGIDGLRYIACETTMRRIGITHSALEYVASVTLDRMVELEEILRY